MMMTKTRTKRVRYILGIFMAPLLDLRPLPAIVLVNTSNSAHLTHLLALLIALCSTPPPSPRPSRNAARPVSILTVRQPHPTTIFYRKRTSHPPLMLPLAQCPSRTSQRS
ncbi:hypothetical protein C8J57DRAFT_1288718 [Mycena rebaudengoi]|nr:hypothetical protein C8J57DRAFT_1288718 [Mycena rebaudengoi]